MYVMVMEMLWNGYEIIIWSCCCSFIMVSVVIRWLVMVHSLCCNSLCVQTLGTYKGKEVTTVCVPGEDSYSGAGYADGSSYTGGGYTGCGSYGGYSGDDGQGYSGGGSCRGYSEGYCGVYGGDHSISFKKVYDKRGAAHQKLFIQNEPRDVVQVYDVTWRQVCASSVCALYVRRMCAQCVCAHNL